MICLSWERIPRKAKAEIFHPYDPAGAFANEKVKTPCWAKLYLGIGMYHMMTI